MIQHNVKPHDIIICVQSHPPGMVPRSSAQNDELDTSSNVKQSQGHTRRHPTSNLGRVAIPTSDPKLMWSLVRLQQSAISQRRAMLAFKSRALASQPTKAVLDEMNAHRTGLMSTQAAVTTLWCQHGSTAMRLQKDLKIDLGKSIMDIDNLKHTLTNTTTIGATVIRAQLPGEDRRHERIAYI